MNEIDTQQTIELREAAAYWQRLHAHQNGLRLAAEEERRLAEEENEQLKDRLEELQQAIAEAIKVLTEGPG